jgi:hypothetical protein
MIKQVNTVFDSYDAAMDSNSTDAALEKARVDAETFKIHHEGMICSASRGGKRANLDVTAQMTKLLAKLKEESQKRHG